MRYKWTLLAMLWGIVFFNYADRQALAAVIPLLREAWHLSPVQEGMLGSAFAWTYGLSSPFAGRLVDRSPFLVFGLAGILLGIVLQFFIREPERRTRDAQGSFATALRAILTTPSAVALLLAFVCANAVAAVLLFWMPTYVHDHFKQNLAFAGFTASFFAQSGSFAGAIFGGWSADAVTRRHRGGRMIVQGGALLLGLPFVVLTGATTSLGLVIVAFIGWGFFKGMYDANIFASMFDVTPPEIRGTVVGVMNMAGWLFGAGTAPVLIGYIAERTSLSTAISSAALVYGVAAALLFVAAARNRASHAASAGS